MIHGQNNHQEESNDHQALLVAFGLATVSFIAGAVQQQDDAAQAASARVKLEQLGLVAIN